MPLALFNHVFLPSLPPPSFLPLFLPPPSVGRWTVLDKFLALLSGNIWVLWAVKFVVPICQYSIRIFIIFFCWPIFRIGWTISTFLRPGNSALPPPLLIPPLVQSLFNKDNYLLSNLSKRRSSPSSSSFSSALLAHSTTCSEGK